jgi:hypothetical protein
MLPETPSPLDQANAPHEVARLIRERKLSECQDLYETIQHRISKIYRAKGSSATPPSSDIIAKRMQQYAEAYNDCEDALKQEMLFSAALATFLPEFFSTGESKILWEKLVELEPGDVRVLKYIVENTKPKEFEVIVFIDGFGPATPAQVLYTRSEPDAEFLARLEAVGLVDVEPTNMGPGIKASWKGMAQRLVELTSYEHKQIVL